MGCNTCGGKVGFQVNGKNHTQSNMPKTEEQLEVQRLRELRKQIQQSQQTPKKMYR